MVTAIVLVTAGCTAQQPGVQATRSRQNDVTGTAPTGSGAPTTDQPTDTTAGAPSDTTPATTPETSPATTPIPVEQGIIDFGQNHRDNGYDGFLTAAFKDIESFWAEQFPELYGSAFTPLSGHIYAAYPDRSDPIPGCGTRVTDYREIEGNAFYCVNGDFMAYDDAELLPQLVNQLGQGAVAVVLAHEFGHAVQSRANEFDQPTILKEQQADCFAGAWAAHIARGESDVVDLHRQGHPRWLDRHDPSPRSARARRRQSAPTHTAPASIGSARSRMASTAAPSAARRSSPRTANH